LELRESTYKRREARFVVLRIKPGPMPSPERSLQRKVEEASTRVRLKTHTPNNLSVSSTRTSGKIVLEHGEIRRNFKESFIEMDEDGDLQNIIRIKMK
jgi:hypothetical protein